jgi:2-phosphosulfolactate phosphatase
MHSHASTERTVVIDAFPESASKYCDDHVIVSVDVIRATTVAVTAVECGRRCVIARDVNHAFALRDEIGDALLAGELKGVMPNGFDMNNSPDDLTKRHDSHRPIVMLSSSGTKLMLEASRSREAAFAACFRNAAATASHLARHHRRIAIIGAGSRNEFREEDQMCCAWIGASLVHAGFAPESSLTTDVIRQWQNAPAEACASGNSVRYLNRTGQMRDFDFVVNHVNDISYPVAIFGNEISAFSVAAAA